MGLTPHYRDYPDRTSDRQKLFHAITPYNPRLVKGYLGALGGGKSTACEWEQGHICLKTPNGRSIAVRKSMNRADMSMVDDFRVMFAGLGRWVPSKSRFEFDNGHYLTICPADDWERFGSTQIVSFFIQEAQEVEYKIFDALNQRLRHPAGIVGGVPYYRGYMDARGVKKSHWLWNKFVKKAWDVDMGTDMRPKAPNPDFVYVRARTKDNLHNLPPGYLEAQLMDHRDELAWQRMMLEGEFGFDIEGRPVYECYNPSIHDAEIEQDLSLPMYRGWDFGYNSPAVVWCQYTRSGRFLVLRELCPKNASREELAAMAEGLQAREFPGRHPSQYIDFGDAAGENENTSGIPDIEYIENYFRTTIQTKRARIKDGLELVRGLMMKTTRRGEPRFAVDKRCEHLREALGGGYHYDEDKTDERPVKGDGYDDVADALRYTVQLVVEDNLYGSGQRMVSAPFASY